MEIRDLKVVTLQASEGIDFSDENARAVVSLILSLMLVFSFVVAVF